MPLVSTDDVQVRLGRALTDSEAAQVAAWLDDLDAQAESRVPGFHGLVAAGSISAGVVRGVFAQAIRRVLLNPEGLRQRSRTIDDYTEADTYDSSVSGSFLYLTDDEWVQIAPASSSGAFSIRPAGATDYPHPEWTSTTTWRWPV